MFACESAWLLVSTLYHFVHFACVKKRNILICLWECSPFISSIPFFTIPVRWLLTHQAKMKLSADFLAASSPASSVCFLFGRQAKLKHTSSICRAWMGWSLSIDQIYSKKDKNSTWHAHYPMTNDNLPSSIRSMNKWPNISSVRPRPYLLSRP